MEGLLGLTKSINDRDSGIRELSVLERMDARIQGDRAKEVQAQQTEQLFYEQMYAQADKLLEKDRKNINRKILKSQTEVGEHLNKFGGSRKSFFEQGGLSVLNDIKNGITRSDEVITYQENKKNLAKILEAKEKGLGHLLSPSDLQSLEDYENNENGSKITYSGIMSEVEIPPSANFDYGTDIPIEKILSHGSNALKIKANYAIAYPSRPEPTGIELIAFAKKMGYGGTGSNTTKLRAQAAATRARKSYNKKTSTKPKEEKKSWLANWSFAVSKTPKVKASDYLEGGAYAEKGLIETIKEKNSDSMYHQLLKDKSNLIARQRGLDEDGFDGNDLLPDFIDKAGSWFNNKVGLKESYEFMPTSSSAITKRILTDQLGYEIKDGEVVNFMPDEKMYRMDGVKLSKGNKLNPDEFTGNYKIKGVVSAIKTKGTDDDILLVDAYNDNGEIDQDATKEIYKGLKGDMGGSEGQLTTVIALENDYGDLFYKEVELTDADVKTAVSNAIGEDDDVTDQVSIEQRQTEAFQDIESTTTEEQIKFKSAIKGMEETFEDAMFKEEGTKYWGANSGGQENRNELMKSFYMALNYTNNQYTNNLDENGKPKLLSSEVKYLIDDNWFTSAAITGDIEEKLKDYSQGNDEKVIIMDWLENQDFEKGSLEYKRNAQLANKWIQMLEMM